MCTDKPFNLIILQIITLFISLSAIAQIDGTFKHNICELGSNCLIYQFNKNGSFEYKYQHDIYGYNTLTGTYKKIGDTLKLISDRALFESKSKIIEKNYPNPDSTKIQISLLKLAPLKGKKDIEQLPFYVSVNDGKYILTNKNGMILIPKTKVKKIEIQGLFQTIRMTDSIFKTKTDKNYIEIFTSESLENINMRPLEWMTTILILKGKKLYPLTYKPKIESLEKDKTFYTKIK